MELVVFGALEASVLSGVSVRVRPSPPKLLAVVVKSYIIVTMRLW